MPGGGGLCLPAMHELPYLCNGLVGEASNRADRVVAAVIRQAMV